MVTKGGLLLLLVYYPFHPINQPNKHID